MSDKWDRENQQITFHTDLQNRVGYRLDPGNTVYYTYDAAGRMTQVQDNTGMSRLSWKWRKRSSVKIAERTYEKRAQALHS